MNLNSINFKGLTDNLIEKTGLDERSGFIVRSRFGLESSKTTTLQELGAKYRITRERVRQLETQAVQGIRSVAKDLNEAADIIESTRGYLNGVGGVRKDELLVNELRLLSKAEEDESVFGNRLRFLFEVMEYPRFSNETADFHGFWYDNDEILEKLSSIHDQLVIKLRNVEEFSDLLREVIKPHGIGEPMAVNLLGVSKKIGVGPYGDIGLSHWEEISPKTVRAKIFLLLKKESRPMHFAEIAEAIGSHAPTVHNELIKDPRFELVGRGTYSMKG
ncbi:MAG: sigma factor-like helix-turn-helix DNA-binding protein [Candidatus Colwellbacteria bacterium]|nr:sigma factor-like helix-turn-helix DNA-binding protein [Candidatus Colwellbacteria bacterium]